MAVSADEIRQIVREELAKATVPALPRRSVARPARKAGTVQFLTIAGTEYRVMEWVKGWRLLKAGASKAYSLWARANDPTTREVVFCDCPSFKFSRGRIEDRVPCKHMAALTAALTTATEVPA